MFEFLSVFICFAFNTLALDVESNMAVNNSYFFENITSHHLYEVKNIDSKWKNQLSLYRFFNFEGQNLIKSCARDNHEVKYESSLVEESVETSFIATLQMLIFENTIPAIYQYSKKLELDEDEYKNIYTNIISESCSDNLSVLSKRRILKIFNDQKISNNFQLPTTEGNPFFHEKLNTKQSFQVRLARELKYTIGLFKVACSWGQRADAYRGLSELLRNSIVSSYVIRQMSGLKVSDDIEVNKNLLVPSTSSTRVHCDGIICRKKSPLKFIKDFPKSIGHFSFTHDLKYIYCKNILGHSVDFEPVIDPSRDEFLAEFSGDESRRIVGQFIALVTKIPDFNVWSDDPSILDYYLKLGIDNFWSGWAQSIKKHIESNLMYEESLELEVANHELFLSKFPTELKVELDLNSGEFDKMISMEGKIEFKFNIDILDNDLNWLFMKYRLTDPTQKEELEKIDNLLIQYVKNSYAKIKDDFSAYIIDGDLASLLANEIKAQLKFIERLDIKAQSKMIKIPVIINVSPFAIVYLKNKRLMNNELIYENERDAQFQSLQRIDSMALEAKK